MILLRNVFVDWLSIQRVNLERLISTYLCATVFPSDRLPWSYQNVLRLEVPVADFLFVAVLHSWENLPDDVGCSCLVKCFGFRYLIYEYNSFAKFCNKINPALVFVNLIKPHNILMVHVFENVDLILKSYPLFSSCFQFIDLLHNKHFTVWFLLTLVHSAKRARCKRFFF